MSVRAVLFMHFAKEIEMGSAGLGNYKIRGCGGEITRGVKNCLVYYISCDAYVTKGFFWYGSNQLDENFMRTFYLYIIQW